MTNANEERERELAEVQDCLNIIAFKHDGQEYQNRSEARIKPNQRLVEVFGIKNVFTDEKSDNHGAFKRETIKRMRVACRLSANSDRGDWTGLRERTINYTKEYIQCTGGHGSINLAELVQFITLKLSLSYLFPEAEIAFKTKDTFKDVKFIGKRINDLWADSKKPDGQRPQWADQHDLHISLRRVSSANFMDMPGSFTEQMSKGTEPTVLEENPLNYLLPAYETMWRVVLRCFIEVHLRNAANSSEWHLVLKDFLGELSNPTCMPEAFHRDSSSGVHPSDIAKESLRLYPPSRRVHREFNGELHRANIESCHRSKLLGGDDPLVFRPERWLNICLEERAAKAANPASNAKTSALKDGEQRLGCMPFAIYCTADGKETRAFAMTMVVMLVQYYVKSSFAPSVFSLSLTQITF